MDNDLSNKDSKHTLGINPFPGLRPFKIEESHLFFGREGQSDEVLLKLSQNRFIGIIGPSGSGKSSFVYCGVLPILYGGFLTEVSADWEVVVLRPGAGPIDNLAESLLKTTHEYKSADPEEKKLKKTIISTLLRSSSRGLVEALEQLKKSSHKNYLILVDQFEELFRFKDSREASAVDETLAFINLLLEAVDHEGSPIYVALTMRSDFIGECAQFADLTKKINDSHYLIPQMTRDQKRKAIEGPIAVGGAEIKSRLVQRLLNDLGDNPDQLPILQHSLMRTWDYWTKFKDSKEEQVDIKHYEAIGTMSEALSLHANEAYDELNERQKHICEYLFKAITEKRGENFGIRRPTKLGDIAAISDATVEEVAEVIGKFRKSGRSLLTPAAGVPLNERSVIDISHESLMRIWVRLKNWVEDEAEAVQMYIRLAEAASMYQLGKAGLWRPPDLQLALNWEAKHKPTLIWAQRYHPAFERTMEFLSHSQKEYETEQRIKELQAKRRLKTARVTAMVMAGLCVVAVGFLMYAFDQKAIADEQTIEARDNLARAVRQQKIADSMSNVAQSEAENAARQRDTAIVAQQRAEQQRLIADSLSDVAAQRAQEALASAELARQNGDTAEARRLEAVAAQIRADNSAVQARIAESQAIKEMYLAQAKTMGFSSQSMKGEQFAQLKGLLAQQAYKFNIDKEGYPYEGAIYYALYDALKQFEDPLTTTFEGNHGNYDGDIHLLRSTSKNVVYSIHQNGQIYAWRQGTGNNVRQKDILTSSIPLVTIKAAALSADEQQLAIAGKMGDRSYALIFNTNDFAQPTEIPLTGFGITDVAFAPNNDLYLLNNQGSSIWIFKNEKSNEILKTQEKINAFVVSRDGKSIYAGSTLGKVIKYNLTDYSSDVFFKGSANASASIGSININKSGIIVFGDAVGLMHFRFPNGRYLVLPSHTADITDIDFSVDGKFMASASRDRTIRLWNLNDLNQVPVELRDHEAQVTGIAFTPDNHQLMSGMYNSDIKNWPTRVEEMSSLMCNHIKRNITDEEWEQYIGPTETFEKEITCSNITALNEIEQ